MNANSINRSAHQRGNRRLSSERGCLARIQYGLLPYRLSGTFEVEVLLVRMEHGKPWTIPKGWPIKGLSPARSAAREGYETARIHGTVGRKSIGFFSCEEPCRVGNVLCEVTVFPMLVTAEAHDLPESREELQWFSVREGMALIDNHELRELIALFAERTAHDAKVRTAEKAKVAGDLVSIEEAAKTFGVTVRTLRRWVAAGKMPGRIKDGREKKFRAHDLDEKSSAVTIQEAAEYLGVTVRTLRRWVAAGKMPARTSEGNKLKFRRADIAALTSQT
jgi:excisionase family DNA binding protein